MSVYADGHAVYAAITSASLSLIATAVDAAFDFGSNVVLYWLHREAIGMDVNKWPVGGARLETIGNITYGTVSSCVIRAHKIQHNI